MPLGFERLNERTKRPNDHINFIKPLPGSDEALSKDFLERIAAICYPIMKANHIYVMALEEHEPNQEFIGRNFNAGEVIQLVLRAPFTGQWMPFKHVQMVMMHELAHCKQMNHSKSFWKVRNQYAGELKELWTKKYTGEGLWGRGQSLLSKEYETDVLPEAVQNISSLCGGTYRSGGRKRKRGKDKPQLSYAERKQRHILKKFGSGGLALGDDEGARVQLESGKKVKGKPRVAGSARGRELRAAAALARFDQTKKGEGEAAVQDTDTTDSGSETDDEDYAATEQAVDINGKKMTDSRGRPLISVCGAEDPADDDTQGEMKELFDYGFTKSTTQTQSKIPNRLQAEEDVKEKDASVMTNDRSKSTTTDVARGATQAQLLLADTTKASRTLPTSGNDVLGGPPPTSDSLLSTCEICSLENTPDALICTACSHVLQREVMPNCWHCQSTLCKGSAYLNSGDAGRCGVCGTARPL